MGFDTVGPIHPPCGEHRYIFHAECPFTRWCWIRPSPADSADAWARFLVEEVLFDAVGIPGVLRSDRGAAFVSGVVKSANELLNTHVFGSSYHPQSQGYIEGRHQSINNILAAFAARFPDQWATWARLAQWSLRATPREDRGGRSAFELVTGMRPQGPLSALFERFSDRVLSTEEYVKDLQRHLRVIQEHVQLQLSGDVERRRLREARRGEVGHDLRVGDAVFVRKPPVALRRAHPDEPSTRLLPRADTTLYFIKKLVSPQAVVLKDAEGRTDLGFAQPVHVSRLIKHDIQLLEAPIDAGKLRLELRTGPSADDWEEAEVVGQLATGACRVKLSNGREEVLDLGNEEYRWLQTPR